MVAGLKARAKQGSDPGKSSSWTGSVGSFNCMRSLVVILLLWFCPFSQSSGAAGGINCNIVTLPGPRERQLDSIACCQEVEDPLPVFQGINSRMEKGAGSSSSDFLKLIVLLALYRNCFELC